MSKLKELYKNQDMLKDVWDYLTGRDNYSKIKDNIDAAGYVAYVSITLHGIIRELEKSTRTPVITDDMVEMAAKAHYETGQHPRNPHPAKWNALNEYGKNK